MDVISRLRIIVTVYDTEPVELALGIVSLVTGGFLLLPIHTFQEVRAFAFASTLMAETTMGLTVFLLGAATIWAVLDGRLPWRRRLAGIRFCIWMLLAWLTGLSNTASPSWPTYLTLAAVSAWVYLRNSVEEAYHDSREASGP